MLIDGKRFGGDGGTSFDDAKDLSLTVTGPNRHYCVQIELHWDRGYDKKLTSICFQYETSSNKYNRSGKHRGRDGGSVDSLDLNQDIFILKKDDHIEKIDVYVGKRQRYEWIQNTIPIITAIQFFTVKGEASDIFGSTENAEKTTEHFPGYIFAYAKGRSGLWIDRLQFVWISTQEKKSSDQIVFF
ncbi:unnamed protein product [Adineta ricciae]|uniref:Jacalin-type lectin domain-containing protein n=1 Tax=Adineta ricciae TaxID=249248 RepID=A0A815XPJ0_ADIRI|nr:unnamed protein product [Adineta ricciae]